ncbi:MAG: holo-ACP synthase [bacterium]
MNAGIGIDIVETSRIRESIERFGDRFKKRVFLPAEVEYCDPKADPAIHYAGRFAAKEAVSKAFGTGIGKELGWQDIEVVRDPVSGAPSIRLHGKGIELAKARGIATVLVSLSHTKEYAAAMSMLSAEKQDETE